MTDGEALLAAIRANPEDDTARLVYADWLDEDHAGRDPERAEFIRVQVELARKVTAEPAGKDPMWLTGYRLAMHREESVLKAFFGDGESCRCVLCLEARERELLEQVGGQGIPPAIGTVQVKWSRGFVESVEVTAGAWLESADALTAQHPVRKVTLTTWTDRDRDSLFPRVFPDYRAVEAVFREYATRADADGKPIYTSDRVIWADILGRAWPGVAFTFPQDGPDPVLWELLTAPQTAG